jgi:hypothetical protein
MQASIHRNSMVIRIDRLAQATVLSASVDPCEGLAAGSLEPSEVSQNGGVRAHTYQLPPRIVPKSKSLTVFRPGMRYSRTTRNRGRSSG